MHTLFAGPGSCCWSLIKTASEENPTKGLHQGQKHPGKLSFVLMTLHFMKVAIFGNVQTFKQYIQMLRATYETLT